MPALVALAVPALLLSQVEPHAGMLRFPNVSNDAIVFSYSNDLWIVDRDGGLARPLASPAGTEGNPRFNPDGSVIAFEGNYKGNRDIYTLPVTGGVPFRVTHHPSGERLCGWTGDDDLIFSAGGIEGTAREAGLFTVSSEGGMPTALPVPYGYRGAISADGVWLAYTPHNRDNRNWKRYRGGMASDVWLMNLRTLESVRVTDWEGTDTQPMWHGKTLYYLSDGGDEHRLNLWAYDTERKSRRQVTRFRDYDVKFASIGPDDDTVAEIVFQYGKDLMLLDFGNLPSRPVRVTIPGDRPRLAERAIDVSGAITSGSVSPSAKRVAVEARGDIWTLPAKDGQARNLTHSDGSAERSPMWSPDGRWIAYFSDRRDEYELYLTQSDGRGETRRLTESAGSGFYYSGVVTGLKHIAYTNHAGDMLVSTVDTEDGAGDSRKIAHDPVGVGGASMSWSHDSRWIAFSRLDEKANSTSIHLYDMESDELHKVTSDFFADDSPAFDRKGEFLYYVSQRSFNREQGNELDDASVFERTQVLVAVPLREDVEYPWALESDEEDWDDKPEEEAKDGDERDGDEDASEDDASEDDAAEDAAADDGVSGEYEGTVSGIPDAPGDLPFTATIRLSTDDTVTGVIVLVGLPESGSLSGTLDRASGKATGEVRTPDGEVLPFEGTIADGEIDLILTAPDGTVITVRGTRTAAATADEDGEDEDENGEDSEVVERVEIEIEGFERRGYQLGVAAGRFGQLVVNNKNHLLYGRFGDNGGIKIYDIHADEPGEESVTAGGSFELSADGKNLLVMRGRTPAIGKAAKGSSPENVKTSNMTAHVDPRAEWMQLYTDAWRLFRDYFYVENLHGVDWEAVRARYEPMVLDCASREDLDFVIRETISELNCGHTYFGGGDLEGNSNVGVGMLGADLALENGAYRITRILSGGAWDGDARSPLALHGVDVHEGDYLLAVNRVPMDTSKDPWAVFVGLANSEVELTVSANPTIDDEARNVIVRTIRGDGGLRYRAWVEHNRAHVAEQSGGRIGYVHVPNTGGQGYRELNRQLYGQAHLDGLIVDDRWNGGGRIPHRFIELLNRPVTNYWHRRYGRDWMDPSESHQGPKCMLINGQAGSGGDMFPWLFRANDLGKIVGTRTWGGLVGLTGGPRLIDGAGASVPNFGFYETDGTWGVEGHGVDPDIEVIDDPAEMQDGADPQLDAAIAHILTELETKTFTHPNPPAEPDRSGMGVEEADK